MLKDFIVALNFLSALIGAGLASGKEVVVFLGNANLFSIILCGVLIGAFSYPFIYLGIKSNGNTTSLIFHKNEYVGTIVMRIINFVFLGAMLSGAESLLQQTLGIHYGGFIIAVLTLIIFQFGDNFIKGLNSLTTPLVLVFLIVLYCFKNTSITGNYTLKYPLLYASMNTTCAGVYAGNFCKELKRHDALFIGVIIASFISIFLVIVRSLIIGVENTEIPIYSVAKDTNLTILGGLVVMISILTSCVSSLRLASSKKPMSPFIVTAFALILSFFGFGNVVKFLYPVIGVIGLIILVLAICRMILIKLKKCKKLGLGL